MGKVVTAAMKICSLVPGATEVVAALGRAESLVGISHECDFPPEVRHATVLVRPLVESGNFPSRDVDNQVSEAIAAGEPLYHFDEAGFAQAQPTVVLAQSLCDVCAVTSDQLAHAVGGLSAPPRIVSLHPARLNDVIMDVTRIGEAIDRAVEGQVLSRSLQAELDHIRNRIEAQPRRTGSCPRVACIEWLDPPYLAGHWVPDMVSWAGGIDALGMAGAPSRRTTWKDIAEAKPDLVVFMPCGYSLTQTQMELTTIPPPLEWPSIRAVRQGRVYGVDASAYFSRPGPRLIHGVRILARLCHPDLFPALGPAEAAPAAFGGAAWARQASR